MVIGCDRVDRRKSGGDGSQAAAERGYRARLGKLEVRGSVIAKMGSRLGDKVEGTVTSTSSTVRAAPMRNAVHWHLNTISQYINEVYLIQSVSFA